MPHNHRTLSRITNCVIVSLCIYDEKIKSIQVDIYIYIPKRVKGDITQNK